VNKKIIKLEECAVIQEATSTDIWKVLASLCTPCPDFEDLRSEDASFRERKTSIAVAYISSTSNEFYTNLLIISEIFVMILM
jgi:hypothetical protein